MTAVARAKTMIEAGLDRTLTAEQLTNIGNRILEAREYGVRVASISRVPFSPADPENITAEEKAQFFIDASNWLWREFVRGAAEKKVRADNDANVIAAKEAAEADLS